MIKGLDLSKFKKVDANRDHTVMQSEEGHIIHISHKAVGKDVHEALRKLPIQKLSQGGPVRRPATPGSDEDRKKIQDSFNSATGWKKMSDGGGAGTHGEPATEADLAELRKRFSKPAEQMNMPSSVVEQPALGKVGELIQAAAQKERPGQAPVNPIPLPPEFAQMQVSDDQAWLKKSITPEEKQTWLEKDTSSGMQGATGTPASAPISDAVKSYQSALNSEASIKAAQADDEVRVREQQIKDQQQYVKALNANLEKKQAAYKEFADFLADPRNQVNPQRLMGNQSTMSRLMTGIGLAIGGAPTQAFLQKQIDEDIKAQQQNINNKSTLYAKNLELLGDEEKALTQTQIMMGQIVQNELSKTALKYGSQTANVNAAKLGNEFAIKNGELLAKEAESLARQQMLAATPREVDSAQAGQLITALVPKEQQAEAIKEVEHAKKIEGSFETAKKAFKQAKETGTFGAVVGNLIPGVLTDSERDLDLANAKLQAILRENKPPASGVMTDEDARAIINPFLIKATDDKQDIAKKEQAFMAKLQSMYKENQGTLESRGIRLKTPKIINFTKNK